MPYRDLHKSTERPQTDGMRLPQSTSHALSTRVFPIVAVTLLVTLLPLSGLAMNQLTVSPNTLHFGNVVIGQSETAMVVLTNNGPTNITVYSAKGSLPQFTASGVQLPLSLPAGQSVSLNATFSPTTTGWVQGTITFASNASNSSLQLNVRGTGVAADSLSISPASVSFGQVAIGKSSTVPIVLTNVRSYKVKISGYQATGTGFSATGPVMPITLSSGQSFTLQASFAPSSTGIQSGSVFISGPNLNVPMSGTGTTTTTAGQLTVAPAPLNFGSVTLGSTGTLPITLSASGASVTVSSDASSNSQYVLNGANFPYTIPAGQSVQYNVSFTPKTSGSISGTLTFASNAVNTQTSESLTGSGTAQQYSVNLSWNASTNVAGYNIYRSTNASSGYTKINPSMDANTAYTDSSVASGQTYYYEATSVDANGMESARSTPPATATIP